MSASLSSQLFRISSFIYTIYSSLSDSLTLTQALTYRCGKENALLNYNRLDGTTVYLCGFEKPLPILSETSEFTLQYNALRIENLYEAFSGFEATYSFVTSMYDPNLNSSSVSNILIGIEWRSM